VGLSGARAANTLHLLPVLSFHPFGFERRLQAPLSGILSEAGNLLLTLSMAAMGLEVSLRFLFRTGLAALLVGAIASVAQILASTGFDHWLI